MEGGEKPSLKKKEKRPDTKHKFLESYSTAYANQKKVLDWKLLKF